MKMKIKKNFIVIILLLTTATLTILNLKNTSKTYLYFLNFKTEKLTLGGFITLSFLAGFTSTFTFSYLKSSKNANKVFNEETTNVNSENLEGTFIESNTKLNASIKDRPPERDIRDSQPTISVNYRFIKQNNAEVNNIDEEFTNNKYQNYDDWEEIESNW